MARIDGDRDETDTRAEKKSAALLSARWRHQHQRFASGWHVDVGAHAVWRAKQVSIGRYALLLFPNISPASATLRIFHPRQASRSHVSVRCGEKGCLRAKVMRLTMSPAEEIDGVCFGSTFRWLVTPV